MSSSSTVRRALKGLEDGLATFTTQLAQETAELRRNADNQPTTGATFYSRILADLLDRLEGLGQELAALEGISLDAISLEELVGHSVALYCQNYQQIQQLETTLVQYGYRELYSPLPPDNPLDMVELACLAAAHGSGTMEVEVSEEVTRPAAVYECGEQLGEGQAGEGRAMVEALGEVTNRLAGARLGAGCNASSPPLGQQAVRVVGGMSAGGGVPRTTLKALAPMTAGKARLLRADTPSSSIASPEAMSPSMRELLGKYAASSNSGGTQQASASAAPPSASVTPPRPGSVARSTPPVPSYLSPAFQLAAMEQEVQMAHAEAAAHQGGTPQGSAASGWQADDAMYNALTATALKLAGAPSFLEAYRQRFPAIMASTERLLQTVEKQRRPAAAAAVAQEEAVAGPMAALAMAAQQAGAPQQHDAMWRQAEEESTMDLMAQVLWGRTAQAAAGAQEHTEDITGAAAVAGSTCFHQGAAAAPAAQRHVSQEAAAAGSGGGGQHSPPDTAALLSRAMGGAGSGMPSAAALTIDRPISSLRMGGPQPLAARHKPQAASTSPSERSKPQLEEAIAVALRRVTTAAPMPAAAAAPSSGTAAASAAASSAAPAGPGFLVAEPLRPVVAEEYAALPTFIKSQLPLDLLNATLAAVHAAACERSSGFTMEDVDAAGLGAKCKVVVNSLVKLGRAQLKALPGSETLYLLV